MSTIKCPNCGKKINALSRVCPYCHADLKTADRTEFHPDHHWMHKIAIASVSLVILGCIAGGGYYGYTYLNSSHRAPMTTRYKAHKSNNVSTNEPSITKTSLNHNLSDMCQSIDSVANQLNQGSTDDGGLSDYFYNGSDNKYYKQVHNWATHQQGVTLTTDAKVLSIDRVSSDKAIIKYRIHYVFNHDHQDHIQEFNWHAHLKYADGSWKITKDYANNNPIVNKTESD